jgi:hypothetical protein
MVFVALACSLGMASAAKGQQPEICVERDIVHGKVDRVELQLNLALPKKRQGPIPSRGLHSRRGWYQGQRQDMAPMTELLARRGYVSSAVSYLLVPSARFPVRIEDCKAAVRWLRANAVKYHINRTVSAPSVYRPAPISPACWVTDKKDDLEGSGGNPEPSSRV